MADGPTWGLSLRGDVSSHTYRRLLVCNYTIAYILYSISCLACNNALSILTMILPKCLSVLYRCYAYCDAHLLHFVLGRDDSRFNISLYTNVLMFHSPSDGEWKWPSTCSATADVVFRCWSDSYCHRLYRCHLSLSAPTNTYTPNFYPHVRGRTYF